MHQHCLEKDTARSLLVMALLAITIIPLLPLHTAHAAPQRPLSTCLKNSYYTGFILNGVQNTFSNWQYFDCNNPNLDDNTWFSLSSNGNVGYITAQGDTWVTQQPSSGGTRYGETGRSSQIAYPNNGVQYYVQTAYDQIWLAPAYGCNWINFPDYGYSHDYNCGDMQ